MKYLLSLLTLVCLAALIAAQVPKDPFPVKRAETPETWKRDGWAAVDRAKATKPILPKKGKPKNVILFIGDGMGVSTLTAARILEGQLRGESGEENRLSFENFPYSALSKTYSTNQQTSDSAPTMSAIITGVKTDEGILSVNQNVVHDDYRTVKGNEAKTLLEYAEEAGLSTGIVSTARLTHATPGACYAHTADRNWESDADIKKRNPAAYVAGFPDIARQLIETPYGDGPEVLLSGGRSKFMTFDQTDPEYSDKHGERLDNRDLIKEWVEKKDDSKYVWNQKDFDKINPKKTKRLMGLFEPSHMRYSFDRKNDKAGEPPLSEMTAKSIDILSRNKKGYFLMVEGGRIDHGSHAGNAYRALTDTIALSDAVRTAASKVDLSNTLIVVTADHSHTLVIQGYPARGNDILGLVRQMDSNGNLEPGYHKDKLGLPYTTLSYANGKGYQGETDKQPAGPKKCCEDYKKAKPNINGRFDLSNVNTDDPDYLQEAAIPLTGETHGGEDVAIFAEGVNAYLFRGSMEENWTFYVMADTLGLAR